MQANFKTFNLTYPMKKLLLFLLAALSGALTAVADDYTELLTNGACNGTYSGWNVMNGGSGWDIGNEEDGSHSFVSSYEPCMLWQTIDLLQKGLSAEAIDKGQIKCKASAEMRTTWAENNKGAEICSVTIDMLDGSENTLSTITVLDDESVYLAWTAFSREFNIVSGTRKLKYVVIGCDPIGWAGQYGPRFRNLSLMTGGEGEVPEPELVLLTCIKSTGAQAFNTGYTHKANTKVVMDCNVVQDHQHNWEALFGASLGNYTRNAFCFFSRTDGRDIPCFNRSGNEPRGEGFVYGERITIVASGKTATWYKATDPNNAAGSVTTTGTADDGQTPMLLFNLNTPNNPGGMSLDTSPSVMTLYGCKIYEGETLVRDFVPATRDNLVGLYDNVTGSFSGSVTSTPFEAGETIDIQTVPWGDNEGGWCGKTNVNDGKNVYYTITKDENGEEHLTISKNPDAVGNDCCIGHYDVYSRPAPWLDYIRNGTMVSIKSYTNYLVIEDGVTGIGTQAFNSLFQMKTVIIPASVTRIYNNAFSDCNKVTDVYCHADPNSLTWNDTRIDDFNTNQPKSTKMHVYTRYLNTYREKFPDANVTFAGDFSENGIIHDCAVDGHEWSEWQMTPPTCTEDGKQYRFCIYCGLEEDDVIPATGHMWDGGVCIQCGKTRLWRNGFCGKPDVNGGKNVSYILTTDAEGKEFITISKSPDAVGSDCSIREYDVSAGNPQPWIDVQYTYYDDGSIRGYSLKSYGEYLVIEDGVTGMGDRAFYHCQTLNTITIPASVTSIGRRAFLECDKVTDVYCHADPDKLTWNDHLSDDFNTDTSMIRSTKMHVFSPYLSAYQNKFPNLNVTFVGDLEDFDDGIASPIEEIEAEGAIYNLAGQRLEKMQKGINIVNGKKILVK